MSDHVSHLSACSAATTSSGFFVMPGWAASSEGDEFTPREKPRSTAEGPLVQAPPTANDEPIWFKPTFRAVDRVQALRKNRDSHRGAPIAAETVHAAVTLLYSVAGPNAPAPAIVPTPSGSIQLEWHQRQMDIEVYVSPDLSVIAWVHDRLSGEEREEDISSDVSMLRDAINILALRT